MFKHFCEVGFNFMCGDVKNFDASLVLQFAMIVADAANRFYSDGPENALIRRTLIATIFSSTHIVDILIYCMKLGNVSGNALTTIINCIINMCFARYVYLKRVENNLLMFDYNVRLKVMGDDNMCNVRDTIAKKYNMLSVRDELSQIGVEYTLASKGEVEFPFVPLSELSFMKRGFVKHGIFPCWMSPLELDTVMETARWAEGDVLSVVDQMARFNTVLLELTMHSRKSFELVRNRFREYCELFKQGQVTIDDERVFLNFDANLLFTYDRCEEILYPEYCKPLEDLASVIGKKHEVLLHGGSDN